jgi:hypothetical protein
MPQTCIDTADAMEVTKTLQLIAGWLAADPVTLAHRSWPTSAIPPTDWVPSALTWTASLSSSAATTAGSSSAKTPPDP